MVGVSSSMPVPTRFRVEFRAPGKTRVLAILHGAKAHRSSLDLYYSPLVHEGKQGWLVLIDDESDVVVAKRRLSRHTESQREVPESLKDHLSPTSN